jgi:hypothetical protein
MEVLSKLDADGSISRMLREEQDDPSAMMTAGDKQRYQQAQVELTCPLCLSLVEHVVKTTPEYVRASEADLITILETICEGPPDTSVPVMLGIAPPPLPPLWTDQLYIGETLSSSVVASEMATWYLRARLPLESTPKSRKGKKKKKKKKKEKKIEKKKKSGDDEKFVVPRASDIKEYRQSMTKEDFFEKTVLVATCKSVVSAKEDIMARHIRDGDQRRACRHVCQ